MEASEWYKLRNDRTNRIDNIILDSNAKTIAVFVQDHGSYCGQVMAVIMSNILSRWCRKVTFFLPCHTQCIIDRWKGQTLNEIIDDLMNSSDPYGEFTVRDMNENIESFDFSITIGSSESENHYWLDSLGWVSGFGYGIRESKFLNKSNENNPIGAVYAAACINSQVFSNYIGHGVVEKFERWHSLFDFSTATLFDKLTNPILNRTPDIGKIWQIGAGAVGSSFDFILSLLPVKGSIHVIDFDTIEIPNTSSSLIFTADHTLKSVKKVDACKEILSLSTNLQVTGENNKDFNAIISDGHLERDYPDCILCFANERNIWSAIQYNEPPLVLHATTSSNWGINFGRHMPFEEWCIVCRFGINEYQQTPVCSTSIAKTMDKTEEKLGILPFLTPVAGIFALAELLKVSQLPNTIYPVNPSFIQLSMKNINYSYPIGVQMSPESNCPVCSDQNRNNYYESYSKSKFAF